jgi:hypothetical protein
VHEEVARTRYRYRIRSGGGRRSGVGDLGGALTESWVALRGLGMGLLNASPAAKAAVLRLAMGG